jgi:ribulose 1,5-bisphosphate synthetase/thiazole synthase
MKYYTEPAKQIPIKAEVDVLVIGSGPAGFFSCR